MRLIIYKLNSISYNLIFFLLKALVPLKYDINLSWYTFNLLFRISGQKIYYETERNKNYFIKTLSKFQKNNNKFFNFDAKDLNKEVLGDLKKQGICKFETFKIENNVVHNVNNYFNNTEHYYESHSPIPKNKKLKHERTESLYTSYDLTTQLNCTDLLKICLDGRLISIAQNYIGSKPRLYSLNTFKTLPSKKTSNQKYFTHEFHRDVDNIKWVVFFIFWTDTDKDNGGFQQIKYSHSNSPKLKDLIKSNSQFISTESFIQNTIPGYGKDTQYKEIFKENIFHCYGKSGTIISCDTFGLHKGMPVKTPRLVTWIRYGSFVSRQKQNKSPDLNYKADLNTESKLIYKSSKYKEVLNDIVNY